MEFLRPLSVSIVVSYSSSMMLCGIQNLPPKQVITVKMPPCLLIQAMGHVPDNQKKPFYTTAKVNEALGITSERGLTLCVSFGCYSPVLPCVLHAAGRREK